MSLAIRKDWFARVQRDADALMFLQHFQMGEDVRRILVVGVHDEPTAHIMTDNGLEVVGVDLREYDKTLPQCNFTYIRGDFCSVLEEQLHPPFDAFVSLSTIEHFGLGAYGEGNFHRYYDVIAMHRAWELLRPGGRAYVTVPFGRTYLELTPHYRIYDMMSLQDRLIQDFQLLSAHVAIAAELMIDGRIRHIGEVLTEEEALHYQGVPPHLSLLALLQKGLEQPRLSPDGR